MIYYTQVDSPLGALLLTSDGRSLTGLYLPGQKYFPEITPAWCQDPHTTPFAQTQAQLAEYFARDRQTFDLPLNPSGTDFQKQVWQCLQQIPFGKTVSYGALAQMLGKSTTASRAVGTANGRNPIVIVVPCHRVIASNGALTGYAGGIERKRWLLDHEQVNGSVNSSIPFQQSLVLSGNSYETPASG